MKLEMEGLFVTLTRMVSVVYMGWGRGGEQSLIGVDSRETRKAKESRKSFFPQRFQLQNEAEKWGSTWRGMWSKDKFLIFFLILKMGAFTNV